MKINSFLYLSIILLIFQLSTCKQVNNKEKNSSITQTEKLNLKKAEPENLIKMDFLKLTKDTIFVHAKNDEILTEQSKTYGADNYLEIIVRSLTEIKRIVEAINFKY